MPRRHFRMNSRNLLRLFLLGLPAGLAVCVVVGLWVYYHTPTRTRNASKPIPASMLRKPLSEADLQSTLRILSTDLAQRADGDQKELTRASNFLTSSLGPQNMGYVVEKRGRNVGGINRYDLITEVAGSSSGTVSLTTSWLSRHDTALSVMLGLAGSFTGHPQGKTVRFTFLATGATPALGDILLGEKGWHDGPPPGAFHPWPAPGQPLLPAAEELEKLVRERAAKKPQRHCTAVRHVPPIST